MFWSFTKYGNSDVFSYPHPSLAYSHFLGILYDFQAEAFQICTPRWITCCVLFLIPSVPFHWVFQYYPHILYFWQYDNIYMCSQTQDLRTFLNFSSTSLNFLEVMSFHLFFPQSYFHQDLHNAISPSLPITF